MADPGLPWQLEGFLETLDAWADREDVGVDLRFVVTEWILTRVDDPYQGVRREPGFPDFWSGVVPGSHDGDGHVVLCSYWVEESRRAVRCDNFGLLSWPA